MDEIKKIIHNVLDKFSQQHQIEPKKLQAAWAEVVPGRGLEHTKISGWRNQTLYVDVDSSARMYQLNLEKAKLLAAIQKKFPEVQKILFKVGNIS